MIETKRGYATKSEVEDYCDIAITDESEAIERIELAEEIIDKYIGFQNAFMKYERSGVATGGTTTTLEDTRSGSQVNSVTENILSYCLLEIISGTNSGESKVIISNNTEGVLTVQSAFTSAIDTTSVYRIYQLAKFPRGIDYKLIDNVYYKYIPEQVKKATLAQVQYMIEMGDDFFISGVDKTSENIDGYDYETVKGTRREIAPKAREYLRGLVNRKGKLIV